MCLILFAYKQHPKYPLILVANRDEFYPRPTAQADWWKEYPTMLAGKDIKGNGSWLGMSKDGKFAALTNFRDGMNLKQNAPTRGKLVTNYLVNPVESESYLQEIAKTGELYNGYNLLTFDGEDIWHYSNMSNDITHIEPGVHGLSNALLNSDWPKVHRAKAKLAALVDVNKDFSIEAGFQMMLDSEQAADEDLPQTGVPYDWEKKLSSMCIRTETYGTRCSTVVLWGADGTVHFEERSYVPDLGSKAYRVQIEKAELIAG